MTLMLAATTLLAAAPAHGQVADQLMNGIGLIDFSHHPRFKVGTWVKYHVTGHSARGHSDDYTMTVAIGGEERLWGEDCFWVETATESKSGAGGGIATLMSYAAFGDSMPFLDMQYYTRKNITESDADGKPIEVVARRPPATLKFRDLSQKGLAVHIDTLGVDTVVVPKGRFACQHVRILQNLGVETERRDSSAYSENKDQRDSYVTREIPLTGIAREDIEFTETVKVWMVGRSRDVPANTFNHSVGQAVLVDFGEAYQPQMVPESKRRSLEEQDRAAARAAAAPARSKPPPKSR
jgi:hypothetical protein